MMPVKTVIGVLVLAILGLNVVRNFRLGYRTGLRGYYVRSMVSLSIVVEIGLLLLSYKLLFALVLVATLIYIAVNAGHVHEIRQNEKELKEKKPPNK